MSLSTRERHEPEREDREIRDVERPPATLRRPPEPGAEFSRHDLARERDEEADRERGW